MILNVYEGLPTVVGSGVEKHPAGGNAAVGVAAVKLISTTTSEKPRIRVHRAPREPRRRIGASPATPSTTRRFMAFNIMGSHDRRDRLGLRLALSKIELRQQVGQIDHSGLVTSESRRRRRRQHASVEGVEGQRDGQ